jgi:DNA ligase-1
MTDQSYRVINHLENHPSRLNKEGILQVQAQENNLEFFNGCRLALDPLITFGVKQVPERKGTDGPEYSWEAFEANVQRLIKREVTGHAARDLIQDMMEHSTNLQWNQWYRRILIKDLRCGVSEKTINKVLKEFPNIPQIPVFECMLAHDGANHESKITGKKLLEIKLDGVRVLTIINVENRTVTQYSRNGKELVNFSHITESLEKNIDLFERSYVLDGEMISSSFQALMKQVHRKDDVAAQDARLMLFDIVPLSEFAQGTSTLGQRRRSKMLQQMKPIFDQITNIDIIEQVEVDLDAFVGELEFKQFNQDAIEQGFEGIMIKDVDAKYQCKRSHHWLKIKPFIEVSLEVYNVEEGTGRNAGRLGALVGRGSENGKQITVNVGSGFSDHQRLEFWYDRLNMHGQIFECRADAITMNQDGTYSLRFPRFLRFRGFTAGEKM